MPDSFRCSFCPCGPPLSVTSSALSAGTRTVATVLAGMVTSFRNQSSARRQWTAIRHGIGLLGEYRDLHIERCNVIIGLLDQVAERVKVNRFEYAREGVGQAAATVGPRKIQLVVGRDGIMLPILGLKTNSR